MTGDFQKGSHLSLSLGRVVRREDPYSHFYVYIHLFHVPGRRECNKFNIVSSVKLQIKLFLLTGFQKNPTVFIYSIIINLILEI